MRTLIAKSRSVDKNKKDIRYEIEWLLECLLIRVKSPATYEHLRICNILPLPSRNTLQKMTSSLSAEFGFNQFALECIKKNLKNKPLSERYGSLMWDEMSIIQDLHYDQHTFKYKGFTYLYETKEQCEVDPDNLSALNKEWQEDASDEKDNEQQEDASDEKDNEQQEDASDEKDNEQQEEPNTSIPDLADHALVLIFRPYKEKWIQPIAVFASKNAASGAQLQKIILKAMILLEENGARVLSTVCDGSQPNNTLWTLFGIHGCTNDSVVINNKMKHPIADSDVFFLRDVPHLFKCIRNHIFNHKVVQVYEIFFHIFLYI